MPLPVAAGQFGGEFPQPTGRRGVASLRAGLGHFRFAPLVEAWREVGSAGQRPVSNQDLMALIASADEFSWNGFLVPLRNAELLRWCFEQGLRMVYVLNLMALVFYPEPSGPFLSSIGY